MSFLCFIFLYFISYTKTHIYECPDYKSLNNPPSKENGENGHKYSLRCNLAMINPKKVINPYKNDLKHFVQSKPFSSVCLKCSMCLAIAKEMDKIFLDNCKPDEDIKQSVIIESLKQQISSLCSFGFENYDLRKFNQIQIVTNEFSCSKHVRSKEDGLWTEKLREMCVVYSRHMDLQFLLSDYLKGTHNMLKYLCSNDGVFRDCTNLNFTSATINSTDTCDE